MPANLRVFDPALCCSTGVCGPSVDPQLIRFAADLEWLQECGVSVERFNLAQQPGAFVEHAAVKQALETRGEAALPLILVDGEVKSAGTYPARAELADWTGIARPAPSIVTDAVSELIALGAAIASNCEACFKFHFDKARKLGVSREDMLRAVTIAQAVKETPARSVFELAQRHLRRGPSLQQVAPAPAEEGPASTAAGAGPASSAPPTASRCC